MHGCADTHGADSDLRPVIGDTRGRERRGHVGRQEHDIGVGLAPQRRLMNVMAMVGRDLDRNAAFAPEHLRAPAQAVERRAGAEYLETGAGLSRVALRGRDYRQYAQGGRKSGDSQLVP